MKTNLYSLILACATLPLFSQVGINTSTPTATLDVNGNMRVRTTPPANTVTGYKLLAQDTGTTEVFAMDPQLIIAASNVNTSVYSAKKTSGLTLIDIGFPVNTFKTINFLTTERTIGSAALFNDSDGTYTIPTTGVYAIGFSLRYGQGLVASLLSNAPGIGIGRTRGGVTTIIDTRTFTGISLAALINITISESNISSIYSFQAGDKISFGVVGGGLDLNVLSSSTTSFYIYKISN
ncbi:hypothetical protein H5J24_13595 [Chryseobacterium capnotolerans]|uniref:hypothetical protein n=1 Tax=Chryseobacterium TaxID=59732 RepID=UPI000839DDEC|nr:MULTISPECIES: hypothetical protein [Chryseobacterium]UHO36844.1 hypothetical protein H5J24_13595 [Chryseobacterium capnotolerans]